MNNISWSNTLPMVIVVIVIMLIYNVLRRFIFDKLRVVKWSKWVVLAIAILLGLLNGYIGNKFNPTSLPYYVCLGVFIISIFTFFDLMGWGRKSYAPKANKKDDIVIRPKAKPNRVKNRNKDNNN
ncbi:MULTISPECIES: hypothetical protein [Clostridium]|jgi:uncharacterized membrane protein YwaF|uniref:hypothetical protein n=1 Tax=Clostridium TaxID=1485 RepID=UPI000289F84D|nr:MULTISPECIES: hypothetical protein [Clostridium]MDF2502693.1 Amino acid permease [Clostridium sp.]